MYHRRGRALVMSLLKRYHQNSQTGGVTGLRRIPPQASNIASETKSRMYNSNQKNDEKTRRTNLKVDNTRPGQEFVSLKEGFESIQELLSSLESFSTGESNQKHQESVLQGVQEALEAVVKGVEEGSLNPSGKHGKGISQFLELVLYAYSKIHIPGVSLYDESQDIMRTLKNWNLDIRSGHYEHAIVLANREGRFKEAADLFLRQIDPTAGYNPVSMSVASPYGLYAIARKAHEEGLPAAEYVFDAVTQLTMVSPSDQEKYVLAAGTALGQTGQWQSAVEFLRSCDDADQLGHPLTASVMQACLLSNRPDSALEAFDYSNEQHIVGGGEWQWGGGREKMDPLRRDLAMRSMKGRRGMSPLALDFFHQSLDENVSISIEALEGIAEACEQDQNLEGALILLFTILQDRNTLSWIVDGSELTILERSEIESASLAKESVWMSRRGKTLASVMRTCNVTSNFGVAWFCAQLVDLSPDARQELENIEGSPALETIGVTGESLLKTGDFCNDLLAAMMVSLCGLRCFDSAMSIYNSTSKMAFDYSGQASGNGSDAVCRVYEYADLETKKRGTVGSRNSWSRVAYHIKKLVIITQAMKKDGSHASTELNAVFAVLATAMKASTYTHQSSLSLILFWWVREQLNGSHREFPVIDKAQISQAAFEDDFAMGSDVLFAEVINAQRWSGNLVGAIDLFESLLEKASGNMENWTNSCNAGLSALIANGQGPASLEIIKALDQTALNQDTYILIGNYLCKEGKWADLRELYTTALKEGYESEELGFCAMKAIVSSRVDNRIIALRKVVDDMAESSGMKPQDWLQTRYWKLKSTIGFKYARLLMWWNDPDTCHLQELDFAIKDFTKQTATGREVKFDTIRTILRNTRHTEMKDSDSYHWIPSSTREWKDLLRAVVEESQSSTLHENPRIIDGIVHSYLALDCEEECVKFIEELLSNGVRVNRKIITSTLNAAYMKADEDLKSELEMMLGP